MRVPLSWLADYVEVPTEVEDLRHRLTLAGVAVAEVTTTGQFEGVEVGRIQRLERHPNADRLWLATVEVGTGTITVVTGAQNLKEGDYAPFAHVGASLWDVHQDPPVRRTLREGRIRGITSRGMVCSAAELGLGDDHDGILILDGAHPVGTPLARVFGETILELEVTPNRADCLSLLGVAHEVAALYRRSVRPPSGLASESLRSDTEAFRIEIADPDLCARYCALRIQNVRVAPSPRWMQERLVAAGVRPISNIVDVTNYVMLELGQPLHAFDRETLEGDQIIVRRARPGEAIVTLDGVRRDLDRSILVIADATRPVGIAGVMGGLVSEVTERTRSVFLESANFSQTSIRRTARGLRLPSEASRRFERGIAPAIARLAIDRAAALVVEIGAGEPVGPALDVYPAPAARAAVRIPTSEFGRLLGVEVSVDEATDALRRLACDVRVEGRTLVVVPPVHRLDVAIPADVVEEVARILGFERLPLTLPSGEPPAPSGPDLAAFEERVRDALATEGAAEIITYSMTSQAARDVVPVGPSGDRLGDAFAARLLPEDDAISLVNPLSAALSVLRTDTVGSMLSALRDNLRWYDRDVLLFEVGRIYLKREGALPEERRIATLAFGPYRSGERIGSRVAVDFFDLKGVAENALQRLGIDRTTYAPLRHPLFRAGRSAAILTGDARDPRSTLLGALGEVDPAVLRAHDIDGSAHLALLDIERCGLAASTSLTVEVPGRFPVVRQDLSVMIAVDQPAEEVRRTIARVDRALIRGVELIDVFQGDALGTTEKSLTFRITYGAADRTLNDAEVARVHAAVEQAVRSRLGARVRGRDEA